VRHVLGEKSARNRYGRLWKEKFVSGTVNGVVMARVNVREQVSVDLLWDVGEGTRQRTVKVINIRTGDASGQNEPPPVENGEPQGNKIAVVANEYEVARQEGESTVSRPPTPEIEPSPSLGIPIDVHGYQWQLEDVQTPIGGL
jgi:hypothetical protein